MVRFNTVKKNDEGLTLIELLIVIALVAIIAAIALPIFLNILFGAQHTANADSDAAVTQFITEWQAKGDTVQQGSGGNASYVVAIPEGGTDPEAKISGSLVTAPSPPTEVDGNPVSPDPISLGTTATYGVLGGSSLANTGPTVVEGDLGVYPSSTLTGFTGAPSGQVVGAVNVANDLASDAQTDATIAYDNAAGLSPTTTGLSQLSGRSLPGGVYSGSDIVLGSNGTLTLTGDANSVWVFQASNTLTIGENSNIVFSGGATACNVFWQVAGSANIGGAAQFQGTVLASQNIAAASGATVTGRLLATSGNVTLQGDTVQSCDGN